MDCVLPHFYYPFGFNMQYKRVGERWEKHKKQNEYVNVHLLFLLVLFFLFLFYLVQHFKRQSFIRGDAKRHKKSFRMR